MFVGELSSYFAILWAVVDPIGTVPVFIAVTRGYDAVEKKRIALVSTFAATGILFFFMFIGDYILTRTGTPLSAFQISGGVILFLFALNMIFGDSKPEEEMKFIKSENETALFPLATPSIAGPGAILAVVLLSESSRGSMNDHIALSIMLLFVLFINFLLMRFSTVIHQKIGNSGAIVVSKMMGLILASMAANNILLGIKDFFKIL